MKPFISITVLFFALSFLGVGVRATQLFDFTQTKKGEIENLMISKIHDLPEVREFFRTCPKSYKPALMIAGEPDSTFKYYWVKVGISNFDMFRTNFNFYIDPKTSKIFYCDQLNDSGENISLKQWRRWRRDPGYQKLHIYKSGKLVVLKDDQKKSSRNQ